MKYVILILLIIIVGLLIDMDRPQEVKVETVEVLKDSIQHEIDTVYQEIKDVKIKYVKERDVIVNNTMSDDYVFFTRYLAKNKQRLDSIDNCTTVERN